MIIIMTGYNEDGKNMVLNSSSDTKWLRDLNFTKFWYFVI